MVKEKLVEAGSGRESSLSLEGTGCGVLRTMKSQLG